MRMVFHHPLPVRAGASSASGIRPYGLLEAFRGLGIEVDVVCGYGAERARAAAKVRANLRRGVRYAFMYAESSTEPTLLTEPHHLPTHPFVDFALMAELKRSGAKLGLFYRDIYWRFPAYGGGLPAWKVAGAKLFYWYDLWQYRRLLDRLYLPSMEMADHVPVIERSRMSALPPGHAGAPPVAPRQGPGLHLLYVGGLGDHYRMHALVEAVGLVPGVHLTICTREPEWRAAGPGYALPADGRVEVVHRSGEALEALYAAADVAALVVEPQPYREFAVPLKVFEYLGACRPILASEGTLAGRMVAEQGIGWTAPYAVPAIASLLARLAAEPGSISGRRRIVESLRAAHTWTARARQVADDLAGHVA